MKHSTACKFCKKALLIEIDDDYSNLGDFLKILPFAACNRCADLRIRRRNIEDAIKRAVIPVIVAGHKCTPESRSKMKSALIVLTKKYTAMIADWMGSTSPWWEMDIVDSIADNPSNWTAFLGQCWKLYKPNDRTMKEREMMT